MFLWNDFKLDNISNIPNSKEQLIKIIQIFENKSYSITEIKNLKLYEKYETTEESFRKTLNHSNRIGILNKNEEKYMLSLETQSLLTQKKKLDDYILYLVKKNLEMYKVCSIIVLLLRIFSGSVKSKTFYSVFALVGKNRKDESAQATVGRNLRSYFSLLKMAGVIERNGDRITLTNKHINEFIYKGVTPIDMYFNSDIVNVKLLAKYINNFFDKDVVAKILTCVSTYEWENYIWTKSSLYKNQGEIENLFGEYIMTLMFKKEGKNE